MNAAVGMARPLSQAQLGLWYAQRLDNGNPIFNTAQRTDITGALNLPAFVEAVNTVMAEVDSLALRVIDEDDQVTCVIDESLRPVLQVLDYSDAADPEASVSAWMRKDMNTPCDPTRDALAAQVLFQLGNARFVWYQRVHHLATDGYGMALIDARVAQVYSAHVTQKDPGKPLAPLSAAMDEDAAYEQSDKRITDRAYWKTLFAQPRPVASLAEGVPVSAHHFLQVQCNLHEPFLADLKALEEAANVSWPDIVMALCAAYVARMTGQKQAVIGAPYMGRLGSASARVPATVMNILPVPVEVNETDSLQDFLVACARLLRQTRRHGRYRSEQLRRDLGLLGGQRKLYGPMVNVLPFDAVSSFAGLTSRVHVMCAGPVDDLTMTFRADPSGKRINLALEANPALYDIPALETHMRRLVAFLSAAVVATHLKDVPTLTADEYAQWRQHAYGANQAVPRTTLKALIEATMQATPNALALEFEATRLDYATLDRRTSDLARRLKARGVGPGTRVAIALPRSVDLVIALVATLRSGAAYLPLDIDHPKARLDGILAAAQPAVLVTDTERLDRTSFDAILCLDELAADASTADTSSSDGGLTLAGSEPGSDDPAYVIYTSGSTGAPKGVVVSHDAIVNRLLWMQTHYGVDATDRILQKTPATFDVSVWEFFLPLISGGVLVVAPPNAHKDPVRLAGLIRQHAITTLHFVPSMLSAFLNEPAVNRLCLKRVFCSGEALPAAVRDRFHQILHSELHNLYGPTEAAVDVSYWPAGPDDRSSPVPIGFPVWNTGLYVLDDHLRPLPIGVSGHLYLAGRQLALGYLGRPDLTDARFVPDPFISNALAQQAPLAHVNPLDATPLDANALDATALQTAATETASRMYVTGDLARRRADGALEFLGRSDHQIKIRGQRIELEEIESVLAHAAGVAQVAVLVRAPQPGQERIVAYVVAHEHAIVSRDVLRTHAAARLPDYMVPSAFVVLPALPVTANGKLDRSALPEPAFVVTRSRAPSTARERDVAALFSQVLGLNAPVGVDDDFFDLGGHSLLAAQLASAIRKQWGYAFSLGAIFEHPTVGRLAQHLDALATLPTQDQTKVSSQGGFGPIMILRLPPEAEAARPLPALFCVHPAGGLSWCYGALARAIAPDRPVYGMQATGLHVDAPNAPDTIDQMARQYVDTLLTLQPQGPYHLAGWSVGGIIVQAMAAELQRRQLVVGGLIMLDAYPADCWRDQPAPPADAVFKALLHIAGYDPNALIDLALTRDGVVDFLRRSGHPLGDLPDALLDGVFHVVAQNNAMVRRHHHQRYDGHLMFFRAALDHEGENLFPRQWSAYVGSMDIHEIPSVHAHMVGADAVALIAPHVSDYLLNQDTVRARAPSEQDDFSYGR